MHSGMTISFSASKTCTRIIPRHGVARYQIFLQDSQGSSTKRYPEGGGGGGCHCHVIVYRLMYLSVSSARCQPEHPCKYSDSLMSNVVYQEPFVHTFFIITSELFTVIISTVYVTAVPKATTVNMCVSGVF